MTEKETAEIRRRFRADKSNISRVRGCYVNSKNEIVSEFDQSLGMLQENETEELLAVVKKTLSGTMGKNLIDIEFSTRQVMEGEEHKLLMKLRDSSLSDDEAISQFFHKVIETLHFDRSYLIMLAFDKYDVFSYSQDGNKEEDSSSVFSYFVCSVCPVRLTKPLLGYDIKENIFRGISAESSVGSPELGFMFPTFDNRAANIYNVLFYTKSASENHSEFVDSLFKAEPPMPAEEQKETFRSILNETVSDSCSFHVAEAVHDKICELIEVRKEIKDGSAPAVNGKTIGSVLREGGVPEDKAAAFEAKYSEEFGADTEISPRNIANPGQFELKTPDISIKVNPERRDLVETKLINGVKYILIRADEGVEVNGMVISIN